MSQLFSIKDKVILITGSSRGIGFELARIMGGEGARVILNGKDAAKLDAAVSELKERGVPAYAAAFDVTDTAGVERAVEDVHSRIGPVDVLVNNAGVQIRSPLEDFAKSDLEKILSVNLEGAFTVSQVVGRYMIRRQKGKIINICSVQSELARPGIAREGLEGGPLAGMRLNEGVGHRAEDRNAELTTRLRRGAAVEAGQPLGRGAVGHRRLGGLRLVLLLQGDARGQVGLAIAAGQDKRRNEQQGKAAHGHRRVQSPGVQAS